VEFLNHRNFLIEKYAKIPKYIIPKQTHLVFHPRFDEAISNTTKDLEEFTYSGFIYVTVVSKKNSNKRIELNSKNLKVTPEDVSVYRSLTWSSIDFDDGMSYTLIKASKTFPVLNFRPGLELT
jgi:hypothetical protein